MQIRFDKRGCLWSIILSIVLTVLLNLAIRACYAPSRRDDPFSAAPPGEELSRLPDAARVEYIAIAVLPSTG